MVSVARESFSVGRGAELANPALHGELRRFLARRLGDTDAEDIVQATLAEALASSNLPSDVEGVRRFVFGIARHKLIDHLRARGREIADEDNEAPAPSGDSVGARDLMRWAERELPAEGEAKRTFEWMLREGDGERLEQIAEEEQIPAPRVRQRVSRLRRYLKARWVAQAAVAGLGTGLLVAVAYLVFSARDPGQEIVREVPPPRPEVERARRLRELAFERCAANDSAACLEQLERARELDPAGDAHPRVQQARAAAKAALAPAPLPTSAPSPIPSSAPPSRDKGAERSSKPRDSLRSTSPKPLPAPRKAVSAPPSKAAPPSEPTAPAPQRVKESKGAYEQKIESDFK